MRRAYLQLLLKEAQQAMGTALVFTGIIVAAIAFLMTRIGVWPTEFVLALVLSFAGFIPLWALWRTYYSLRQEWTGDHMYLLLALPVPGWYITSTKLIVALVELLIYTALVQGAALLVLNMGQSSVLPEMLLSEPAFISTSLRMAFVSLAGLLIGMIVIQFAYLAARLVSKRQGLMMLFLALVGGWLIIRLGGLISPLLAWLPKVPLHGMEMINNTMQVSTIYIGVAPLVGALLASFGLFWFASNLLERDIEL